MQAADVTLGQVFFKNQQNVIPLFQRPYVWSLTDNWEPLWEDIKAATVESYVNGHNKGDRRTYFLGAIVLQDRPEHPKQVELTNVIDGQQRLTTLQILFASARVIANGMGFETVANKFEDLIFNSEKIVDKAYPNDRFKLWPLPQDLEAFLWAVEPECHKQPTDAHRIVHAKNWFTDTIGDWAYGTSDAEGYLNALYETLQKRMQLVQIELEEGDDPQVIFEVLNNRGVQLDAADLVKNLLFQKLESSHRGHLGPALLNEVWLPLDKAPWRNEVSVGRQKRRQLDVLLSYWLPLVSGNATTVEHLFADIKSWMNESSTDAEAAMRSIREHADLQESLKLLPLTDRTGALVDRMTAIDVTTLWPLILFFHADASIPTAQRDKAIVALDSFIMRRMVCRLATNSYTDLMILVLGELKKVGPNEVGDRLISVLRSQTATGRLWPSDDEVSRALAAPNFYKQFALKRSRTLLVSLNNALWSDKTESSPSERAAISRLTIEHLLPQAWEKNWSIPISLPEEDRIRVVQRRTDSVHSLGNLTLLTMKLNATNSNKAWPAKRTQISKQSLLLLTTSTVLNPPTGLEHEFGGDWAENWDEERINLRTKWLTELAIETWPRDKEMV